MHGRCSPRLSVLWNSSGRAGRVRNPGSSHGHQDGRECEIHVASCCILGNFAIAPYVNSAQPDACTVTAILGGGGYILQRGSQAKEFLGKYVGTFGYTARTNTLSIGLRW